MISFFSLAVRGRSACWFNGACGETNKTSIQTVAEAVEESKRKVLSTLWPIDAEKRLQSGRIYIHNIRVSCWDTCLPKVRLISSRHH